MNFFLKYLKYKSKFESLIQQTIIADYITYVSRYSFIDIYLISYNLSKSFIPDNILYDFVSFFVNNQRILDRNNYLIDTETNEKITNFQIQNEINDYTRNVKIQSLVNIEPDIDLIQAVLCNLLNICKHSDSLNDFILHCRTRKTFILDFANVYGQLSIYFRQTKKLQSDSIIIHSVCTLILNFCYKNIRDGHNVIIIIKPIEMMSASFNDELQLIGNSIKDLFFGTEENKTEEQKILIENLNKTFFIVHLQLIGITNSSNYDDFVFWCIAIGFYKIYKLYNTKINNLLYLVTNDKQILVGDETKNILNFNGVLFENMIHISYHKNNPTGIDSTETDSRREIQQVIVQDRITNEKFPEAHILSTGPKMSFKTMEHHAPNKRTDDTSHYVQTFQTDHSSFDATKQQPHHSIMDGARWDYQPYSIMDGARWDYQPYPSIMDGARWDYQPTTIYQQHYSSIIPRHNSSLYAIEQQQPVHHHSKLWLAPSSIMKGGTQQQTETSPNLDTETKSSEIDQIKKEPIQVHKAVISTEELVGISSVNISVNDFISYDNLKNYLTIIYDIVNYYPDNMSYSNFTTDKIRHIIHREKYFSRSGTFFYNLIKDIQYELYNDYNGSISIYDFMLKYTQ
jgi:hypothetical protein